MSNTIKVCCLCVDIAVKGGKMLGIYENRATGIRVCVRQEDITDYLMTRDGRRLKYVREKRLITDGGQLCIPILEDNFDRLNLRAGECIMVIQKVRS